MIYTNNSNNEKNKFFIPIIGVVLITLFTIGIYFLFYYSSVKESEPQEDEEKDSQEDEEIKLPEGEEITRVSDNFINNFGDFIDGMEEDLGKDMIRFQGPLFDWNDFKDNMNDASKRNEITLFQILEKNYSKKDDNSRKILLNNLKNYLIKKGMEKFKAKSKKYNEIKK